jgi:hypothetical protein
MPAYAIGVDVGGTFTDCFVTDGVGSWRGKAPTTPRRSRRLMAALEAPPRSRPPLRRVLAAPCISRSDDRGHQLPRAAAGAPTGSLVTRGFGDLWPMARGHRSASTA